MIMAKIEIEQRFTHMSTEPYTGRISADGNYALKSCSKCFGTGHVCAQVQRSNTDDTCYDCKGSGYRCDKLYTSKQVAAQFQRHERQEKKRIESVHISSEINALHSIKQKVRNGFYKIERIAVAKVSDFIGSVGDRIERDVTLTFTHSFDGFYGTTWINSMIDADGNVIVYKGGNCLGQKGDTFTIKGTVKEHAVYKETKQTVINRPKRG